MEAKGGSIRGMMYALLGVSIGSVTAMAIKLGFVWFPRLNIFHFLYYFNAINLIFAFYAIRRCDFDMKRCFSKGFKIFLIRNTFGGFMFIFYSLALSLVSMTKACVLYYGNAAFTMLFQYLLYKEVVSRYDLVSFFTSVIGLLLLIFGK